MLEMLGILEPLDLAAKGHNTADTLHLMIEAMHLAYQDRYAYIGDADFVDVPVTGLLHPAFHAERRALIDPAQANRDPQPGNPRKYEDPGASSQEAASADSSVHTTHFVVVDGWGNIATVTTTIESVFGTGMVVPGYGFLLNNEMTDFDFQPGGPNSVAPYKRPRSSMTPTIVMDTSGPIFALGSPGGPTITTTVMQVLLNVLEHGMSLEEAVKAPRIYSATYPSVRWEVGIDASVRGALAARGHQPDAVGGRIGNVQSALFVGSGWIGVADTRAGQGGVEYVPADSVRRSP
jgi:gamma-glutamyltranspeptidase / glutathione hydrolase